jgi:signal transduction histidine kinase
VSFSIEKQDSSTLLVQQERDLKTPLLWLYAVLTTFIFIGLLIATNLVRNQLEDDIRVAELLLAKAVAAQIDTSHLDTNALEPHIQKWFDSIDNQQPRMLNIVKQSGEIVAHVSRNTNVPTGLEWQNWQRFAIRQALNDSSGTYISSDPDANRWLLVSAPTQISDTFVMLQRPAKYAFGASRVLNQGIILVGVVFFASTLLFWTYLSRRIISPLAELEAYSGLIRWRGSVRGKSEHTRLEELSKRQDQIGNLAQSLIAMEQDIAVRFMQLSTLLETGRIVASSLDVAEVINNILDQVQQLLHVERCAIVVMDQRIGLFRIRASRGLSEAYAEQLRIAPTEPNSPSMRALRNQEPVQVANTETDLAFSPLRPRASEEGYRSVLAIPLQTQHAPPAVLLIYKDEPYRYSFTEMELASSFAHHASIAMDNAALYARSDERLQEQTSRLESIVESLNDGLILESPSGQVLYCNQQAADLCELPRRVARRKRTEELIDQLFNKAAERETAVQALTAVSSNSGTRSFDLPQVLENGRLRDLRISIFDVTDANGELLGRGQLWQDITLDKELDRMKSALLSTVSHELRTPLATIKGYASTLLANDIEWDAAAQREFLQTISNETDRLTNLVKNLLDMSRIEAGILDMHCELYSLNDVVNQVVQGFRPRLDNRILFNLTPTLPPVLMDVPRIGTAVRNLIDNAVKYSPPESQIELETTIQIGAVQLTVRDYGPGVPQELHNKIFDRFVRADNRLTRQVGGTGLGLAICKGFIEAHEGTIWVKSSNPGIIFGFSLPLTN